MVVSSLKYQARRRGRPSKNKPMIDLGTLEQQEKRNTLLSFISSQQKAPNVITSKALGGSFLHQQFCLGNIDQKQLRIGLICQKTFFLASRSMGIRTRLSSISSRWGVIRSHEEDNFESKSIEEKWKDLRKILFEVKNNNQLKDVIINLILFDERHYYDQTQLVSTYFVNNLQSALDEIGKMINKLKSKKFKIH